MSSPSTVAQSLLILAMAGAMFVAAIPAVASSAADLPLEGITWRVSEYRWRDTSRSAGTEVAARFTMTGGKVRGSGGCNPIKGRYATVGAAIAFEMNEPPDASCAEQTMLVESGLLEGLAKAASFEIGSPAGAATELLLRDGGGREVLRFVPDDAGTLSVGEWRLTAYTAGTEWIAADDTQLAVLAFAPERQNASRRRSVGSTVGSTGCNGLVADYFQQASVLGFGQLDVTEAPCSPATQAQQAAIVAVLDATSQTIELPPDRLLLTSADTGERLEFETSMPLEGSTWLLARVPGTSLGPDVVTMRLVDGELTGVGPCGVYSGRYQTNGVLLAFSGVAGADTAGCKRIRDQRQLLNALRDTVLVDRTTQNLRLLDAFGRVTALFQHPGGP